MTLPLVSANLPIGESEDSSDSKERHSQILSIMDLNKEYSAVEIAELVGLKGSRTRQLLKELVDSGKIEAKGNTKGKRYIRFGD